jgi:hypothetical protein
MSKYIQLLNDNNLKNTSLEDNIYFTLRDIFWNINNVQIIYEANELNDMLTNYICYEDRTPSFIWSNVLNDKKYLVKLKNFLEKIKQCNFETFEEIDDDKYFYIELNIWFENLDKLKKLINEKFIDENSLD